MPAQPTRRDFLGGTSVAALSFWLGREAHADPAPREKLKVACIGVGGKGEVDVADLTAGNVCLGLCDVDRGRLDRMAKKLLPQHPDLKVYTDYRRMFDELKGLDAVTVTTPDHHHGPATCRALSQGIATYIQKPMAHTVYEVRLIRELAKRHHCATQMGNQGTSFTSMRETVEVVQSGVLGHVTAAHVWTNRPIWPQGLARPAGADPVPAELDWDLWLGPAPVRPFKRNAYHSFNWRGWYDFGTGALGDMGCHTMNMVVWALKLGYPTAFQRVASDAIPAETYPNWSTIKYEFPEREGLAACSLTWYDGKRSEEKDGVKRLVRNYPPRDLFPAGVAIPDEGTLLIGTKGTMVAGGSFSENWKLYPSADFKDFKKPAPTLPRSPGHMAEFVRAVKGGPAAQSNAEFAGFLTEVVLAGCLAMHTDKRVQWDGPKMTATNAPELAPLIDKAYRPGWELPGREVLKG